MKLKTVSTITICLLLLLGSCKKEEKLQEHIIGTWKTTSYKVNGNEELHDWKPSLEKFVCGSKCWNENKQVMETWSINEGGSILVVKDKVSREIDKLASDTKCSCVYDPKESYYNFDYNYTWELSSDGKTFTIIYAGGSRNPYEVKELTKKKLQLSSKGSGKHEEYIFEKH